MQRVQKHQLSFRSLIKDIKGRRTLKHMMINHTHNKYDEVGRHIRSTSQSLSNIKEHVKSKEKLNQDHDLSSKINTWSRKEKSLILGLRPKVGMTMKPKTFSKFYIGTPSFLPKSGGCRCGHNN